MRIKTSTAVGVAAGAFVLTVVVAVGQMAPHAAATALRGVLAVPMSAATPTLLVAFGAGILTVALTKDRVVLEWSALGVVVVLGAFLLSLWLLPGAASRTHYSGEPLVRGDAWPGHDPYPGLHDAGAALEKLDGVRLGDVTALGDGRFSALVAADADTLDGDPAAAGDIVEVAVADGRGTVTTCRFDEPVTGVTSTVDRHTALTVGALAGDAYGDCVDGSAVLWAPLTRVTFGAHNTPRPAGVAQIDAAGQVTVFRGDDLDEVDGLVGPAYPRSVLAGQIRSSDYRGRGAAGWRTTPDERLRGDEPDDTGRVVTGLGAAAPTGSDKVALIAVDDDDGGLLAAAPLRRDEGDTVIGYATAAVDQPADGPHADLDIVRAASGPDGMPPLSAVASRHGADETTAVALGDGSWAIAGEDRAAAEEEPLAQVDWTSVPQETLVEALVGAAAELRQRQEP